MPIRIASLHRQIEKSGAKLHRATLSRIHSHGADDAPSDQERARRRSAASSRKRRRPVGRRRCSPSPRPRRS